CSLGGIRSSRALEEQITSLHPTSSTVDFERGPIYRFGLAANAVRKRKAPFAGKGGLGPLLAIDTSRQLRRTGAGGNASRPHHEGREAFAFLGGLCPLVGGIRLAFGISGVRARLAGPDCERVDGGRGSDAGDRRLRRSERTLIPQLCRALPCAGRICICGSRGLHRLR